MLRLRIALTFAIAGSFHCGGGSDGVGPGGSGGEAPGPVDPSNRAPQITSQPGLMARVGMEYVYDVQASDLDADDALRFSLLDAPEAASIGSQNGLLRWTPNDPGAASFRVQVDDGAGGRDEQTFEVRVADREVDPPVPGAIPELDSVRGYSMVDAFAFWFTGPSARQQGVMPSTIDGTRLALIHGRVLDRSNQPLQSVRVTSVGHAEFGEVVTAEDGRFMFAVNGGARVTLRFERSGHLTAERTVETQWLSHEHLGDIVLVVPREAASPVRLPTLNEPAWVEGPEENDVDGKRRARLLFRPGITAEAVSADGTTTALEELSIRITEFTVGENGPAAMPGSLPPLSGYTYALDLTVEEAAPGAQVRFSSPVPLYVENFLDFPVGVAVPLGYYDDEQGRWVARPDGRVIEVLSVDGGLASVDIDGDALADTGDALLALNIDQAELRSLSEFEPGTQLWRSELPHFSAWDCNWPYGPPRGAFGPDDLPDPNQPRDRGEDSCQESGSIIECDDGSVGESVPVVGTQYELVYRSRRQPGFEPSRRLNVPITGDRVPSGVALVEVEVAGRRIRQTYNSLEPNMVVPFVWDGLDTFGRPVPGLALARVRVGYGYRPVYRATFARGAVGGGGSGGGGGGAGAAAVGSFGRFGDFIVENGDRNLLTEDTLIISWGPFNDFFLSGATAQEQAVAGWSISPHHLLFETRAGRQVVKGDGTSQTSLDVADIAIRGEVPTGSSVPPGFINIEGFGQVRNSDYFVHHCTGIRGRPPELSLVRYSSRPVIDIETGEVRRPTQVYGSSRIFANIGVNHPDGSFFGLPRVPCAPERRPEHGNLVVDGEGGVIFVHGGYLLRYDSEEEETYLLAGNGDTSLPEDWDLSRDDFVGVDDRLLDALETSLPAEHHLAVSPDGDLYLASPRTVRVLRGGFWVPVAGFGDPTKTDTWPCERRAPCFDSHAGTPARTSLFSRIEAITIGEDGSLYLGEALPFGARLRRIGVDGILTTRAGLEGSGYAAGSPSFPMWEDAYEGVAANQVPIGFIDGLAFARETGAVVMSTSPAEGQRTRGLILTVDARGLISRTLGKVQNESTPTASLQVGVDPLSIDRRGADHRLLAFNQDGRLLYTADFGTVVYQLRGFELEVADERDALVHVFDREGSLLRSEHAYTREQLIGLEYDAQKRLVGIVEDSGDETTIERNASGEATAIVGPYGHRTEVQVVDGLLASITDPIGRTWSFEYSDDGLMLRKTNPKGEQTTYTYRVEGEIDTATLPGGGTKSFSINGDTRTYRAPTGEVRSYEITADTVGTTRTVTHPWGATSELLVNLRPETQRFIAMCLMIRSTWWTQTAASPSLRSWRSPSSHTKSMMA